MGLLDKVLAPQVATAEAREDEPQLVPYPGEEALIAQASPKRRAEFITARQCARAALAKLRIPAQPILRGPTREPLWPKGIVGTLTHTAGFRGAAVAHSLVMRSVGVDAEPHLPLPDGVLGQVALPEEKAWLDSRPDEELHWDRLLFCAKEATYKAWFPLTGRWLGFEDARISFEEAPADGADRRGTFHVQLLVPGQALKGPPLAAFDGQWAVSEGFIVTGIAHGW
ncbi:MAG: 4'-phosphopantetheinyl transferase family protein [Segniliparus sp.]|uniref:4'-phosphopantetheinyl transferase family protein n=1 Tax=Segniliparus sp. TaxID=2804064 RepID=UPI003F316CDF